MTANTSEPPCIEAVIVHYGELGNLELSLAMLEQSFGVELGITVVYNGPESTPPADVHAAMCDIAHSVPRGVELVRPARNGGFAAGLNRGVASALQRHAKRPPDHFVFFNHDVVCTPETLGCLVAGFRDDPGIAAVGPIVLETPPAYDFQRLERGPCREASAGVEEMLKVWNAGSDVSWPSGRPRSRLHGGDLWEVPPEPYDVGFLAGCAFAMPTRHVERFSPFTEDYFLYFEDADLGERIRRAGLRSVVMPDCCVHHVGGAATSGKPAAARYFQVRNRILFMRRWAPSGWSSRLHLMLFTCRKLLRGGRQALGVCDGWSGRMRCWEEL